jgi:hypothetical protein
LSAAWLPVPQISYLLGDRVEFEVEPNPKRAAVIDLSMMTCQQFLASNKTEIEIVLSWLDGYYKDEKDPPVIDTDTLVANLRLRNWMSIAPRIRPSTSLPQPANCSGSD